MNLTRNFTLSELTKSDTAIRRGINNNPSAEQVEKLKALCENILQPVRDHFGRVKITSGFRSVELCEAIGSSARSQHAKAEAADFECIGVDNVELFDWIKSNLEPDQMILEFYIPTCTDNLFCTVDHWVDVFGESEEHIFIHRTLEFLIEFTV